MAKNGFKVLDSDMHVFEPHDLYLKHMDPRWGDRIPRGEPRKRHGQIRFTFADGTPVRPGGSGLRSPRGAQEQRFDKVAPHYRNSLARDYDPVSQLDAMDVEGLDVAVLFRTFPLHCDDGLEAEYAMALCRAWNDWIFDFCKEDPARMKFAALITLHDVELAVEEARRAVEQLGAAGLCLVPEPVNGNHIHDHCFDPLWAEAERTGVPICFHPAGFPRQEHAALRFVGHPNGRFPGEHLQQGGGTDDGHRQLLRRRRAGAVPPACGRFSWRATAVGCRGCSTAWTSVGTTARTSSTSPSAGRPATTSCASASFPWTPTRASSPTLSAGWETTTS